MITTKFDPLWQIARTKARSIKDPQEKIAFIKKFMLDYPNVHNYERVFNWLNMTKVAYRDKSIQLKFDEAIEWLKNLKNLSNKDNEVSLQDISDDDLLLIYKDLSKRKYGFQFKSIPQQHIKFMQELESELTRRKLR